MDSMPEDIRGDKERLRQYEFRNSSRMTSPAHAAGAEYDDGGEWWEGRKTKDAPFWTSLAGTSVPSAGSVAFVPPPSVSPAPTVVPAPDLEPFFR